MADRERLSRLFAAAAFGLLLAAGLAAAIASLDELGSGELETIADPKALWSGAAARVVTRVVNDQFAPRKLFHRIERSVAWLALHDWGARVREGCPGWLFLSDELELHAGRDDSAALRSLLAQRLRARLQREGVALLVAVVPDKSRIESAKLCGVERAPRSDRRAANWISGLRERGVEALDLTGALARLPGERYYRTDTHWNERGAEAAAEAIAAELRRLGLAPERDAPPEPLHARIVERPGDLVRVAGLDALPAGLRPAPDSAEVRVVPAEGAASDELFGQAGLPAVVVVGTSYSRTSNLVPFVARHLGEQVANAAKEGGDFDGAVVAYLASAGYRESRPKVVVWEVPERVIEAPIKTTERAWLKGLSQ